MQNDLGKLSYIYVERLMNKPCTKGIDIRLEETGERMSNSTLYHVEMVCECELPMNRLFNAQPGNILHNLSFESTY